MSPPKNNFWSTNILGKNDYGWLVLDSSFVFAEFSTVAKKCLENKFSDIWDSKNDLFHKPLLDKKKSMSKTKLVSFY